MAKISGGCLCGSVRYSTEAEPAMVAVCHCIDCQKQSGSPFSVNVLVPSAEIAWDGETRSQYVIKGDSGEPVMRNFCRNCGSPLATELPAFNDLAALKAGTLDDSSWVKPTVQIWCDNAQPWGVLDDELQKAPRNPG